METSYETALYESRHAAMSENLNIRWSILIVKGKSMRMEHYMRRKHHLNMSMESYISMAATRCNQMQDDSLVNCVPDMRNELCQTVLLFE